mgnify:CR=1 FL=1
MCTNFKVHTFTGPGTFTLCSVGNSAGSNTVDYLVVAGAGGGGMGGNAASLPNPGCQKDGGGGGGRTAVAALLIWRAVSFSAVVFAR